MRIIHLNTERTWRGGEQQMCYLAAGLQRRGHACIVACRPGSPCMEKARALGLPVEPLAMHPDTGILAGYRLARLAERVGAEILHAHTARTHLAAVWGKRFARRPLRVVVHRRVDFSIHKLPFRLSGLKYRRGVDCYVAITEAVRRIMIGDGIPAGKIRVIHSSTDLSRFEGVVRRPGLRAELGVPEGAPLIGALGALVGHKAHRDLLDAVATLRAEFPDLYLLIVGEGVLRGALEAQARALGIADRVRLPGFRPDVPQCLAELEVFVMSSREEGQGGSALEAMAMRRPVVATAAGGLVEVVRDGENGLLVPPATPSALAGAIARLLRDAPLARRLAEAGRRTVESEFTSDRMVERTITLYESLLGADAPPAAP